ncbi:MAG: 3-methyl-2-oxobutanoate hydroxymethyltransferase [Chromatiales bacterium]|jgi:3-methyl-2-oxobutanoate hydroxymethyltransferase|nr:3-methyl-2-oxobutanoate hydroxymethyltransferase [Chromatiales bacterium]MDX9766754.1 3-methyl-2-oxobutanoate hydroxymethyltransferase [Ectothiorhodospiraceae bacterium]
MSVHQQTRRRTVRHLREMRGRGEKIVCLTAYDASFAALEDAAGVDLILVGDSLGMVIQGHDTTLPVTVDDVVYHCRAVARSCRQALLMADMPFLSYTTPAQALANAGRLMQEGGVQAVKLEGDAEQAEIVAALAGHGIPVCAHLGLRPQSVNRIGGYRVQGRDAHAAQAMIKDARAVEAAGADLLLLECVPVTLAAEIRAAVEIPVIGIGAGPHCDGQILVLHDILGVAPDRSPRFAKNFLAGCDSVQAAIGAYCQAVRDGSFPAPEHCFQD